MDIVEFCKKYNLDVHAFAKIAGVDPRVVIRYNSFGGCMNAKIVERIETAMEIITKYEEFRQLRNGISDDDYIPKHSKA